MGWGQTWSAVQSGGLPHKMLVVACTGNKACNLQAVACHAGHAARFAQQHHAVHADLTQYLRANAVGAQVHAAALGGLGGCGQAVKLRDQLLLRFRRS